jgi:hypothetical protein
MLMVCRFGREVAVWLRRRWTRALEARRTWRWLRLFGDRFEIVVFGGG